MSIHNGKHDIPLLVQDSSAVFLGFGTPLFLETTICWLKGAWFFWACWKSSLNFQRSNYSKLQSHQVRAL